MVDLDRLPSGVKTIRFGEPLGRHSGYGTGGCAQVWAEAENGDGVKFLAAWARERGVSCVWVGNGSNILFSDLGLPGVVARLAGPGFDEAAVDGNRLIAGAAAQLARVVALSVDNKLGGLEHLWGVPGTVGGAVMMNAGALERQVSDVLEWVEWVDGAGVPARLEASAIDFGYRRCGLSGGVVTRACFKLSPVPAMHLRETVEAVRARKHFYGQYPRTCGSVFKNPPGVSAGTLLDRLGAKGMRLGGARVCPEHANVIYNEGGAKSSDIYQLMRRLQDMARGAGQELEPEIHILGEF